MQRCSRARPTPSMAEVPFIVIGGYLGAGKTTLINEILASDHGRRVGVLVNDFGDINIDTKLIKGGDEPLISLANGCVCCRLGNELGSGIETLLNVAPTLDALLIETSGVAYPAKIAAYGNTWPGLSPGGTLVMADAGRIQSLCSDKFVGRLVAEQLRQADQVLVTKLEKGDDWATLRHWFSTQSSGACVLPTGEFSCRDVFEIRRSHHSPEHSSNVNFATRSFVTYDSLHPDELKRWVDDLPPEVERIKGIFYNAHDPEHEWVIQGVGLERTISAGKAWGKSPKQTEVVLIWPAALTPRIPDGILGGSNRQDPNG